MAAALADNVVMKHERVVQALNRRQRGPSYDPLRVERVLVDAGIPYHEFCPTPAPAVAAPPMTHCVHTKRKKKPQAAAEESPKRQKRLQRYPSTLRTTFPANLNKRDFRRLDGLDVVAVAGDPELGAPFYLVNRSSSSRASKKEVGGQFLGKPVNSGHFVGPYALAWENGNHKEVQSNRRQESCAPLLSKDRELIVDGVDLDEYGFLKRSSARAIARALPAGAGLEIPRALLRGLDSDLDDSSEHASSDEESTAKELEGHSEVEGDEDSAEGKEVVAPIARFASYEEKLNAELKCLPKTRVRSTHYKL
jgi:hypothetical protein